MKLSKKKEREFAEKIRTIKKLEQQKKQAEDAANLLKAEIKVYMEKNQTSELIVDIFTVHYTSYMRETFDTKALKAADEELYRKYLKQTEQNRFTIN
ncbi:MAG: hypothetical protein K2H29_02770 [Oscillospiraceae bacterium]|nr:hypothetical protein [Oscillospiraceae bacterium]